MPTWTAIFSTLAVLLLVLVARSSGELQCGELLNNLNTSYPGSTLYGQKYAGQAFSVDYTTYIFNLTLGGGGNGTAQVSICTGSPDSSLVPLPNSTLELIQKLNQTGGALYIYNATQPGILLSPSVIYWVVLNGSSDWAGWRSMPFNVSQPSSSVHLINKFSLYDSGSGWATENATFGQVAMQGCYVLPSPSPTSSPSPSPSPSRSPSPSPTPSPSPSASPSPSPSRSPSSSPTSSPSPSPFQITPITADVTASFGQEGPAVYLSAPLAAETVAVNASLSDMLVDGASVPPSGVTVRNRSSTTQEYAAKLDDSTLLAHEFSFHREAASGEFGGKTFSIGAGTVKWSINITANGLVDADAITLRYLLADFSSSLALNGSAARFSKRPGVPLANMTTYFLFLSNAVAEVQVFDLALIDGVLRSINHSVVMIPASTNSSSYVLELSFPGGFTNSLYYDPSLGLGVLLGSGGGGDSTNVGLIVGVTVGVSVAVLLVSGVIVASAIVAWWRRRQRMADQSGVNWDNEEEEHPAL